MLQNINLPPIFQAIIILFSALITYKLVPWIKSKTTEQQRKVLRATIKVLVFAAEQLYGAGKGEEKMRYVKQQLQMRGFDIDVPEIEAAVGEFINNVTDTSVTLYEDTGDDE